MCPGSEAAGGQGENKQSYSEASTPRVSFMFKAHFWSRDQREAVFKIKTGVNFQLLSFRGFCLDLPLSLKGSS